MNTRAVLRVLQKRNSGEAKQHAGSWMKISRARSSGMVQSVEIDDPAATSSARMILKLVRATDAIPI